MAGGAESFAPPHELLDVRSISHCEELDHQNGVKKTDLIRWIH